jgi:hypothetical protein
MVRSHDCMSALTRAILIHAASGYDSPQASPLCDRRLGHHQQVRTAHALSLVTIHVRRTRRGPEKRGQPGAVDVFRNPVSTCCNTVHGMLAPLMYRAAGYVAPYAANAHARGSKFLKAWMEFLEEHADLRYPNLADVYVDEQNG